MDHDYIEQFDLVDRYLMGKLAAEESARFEEHFVDCLHCIDRLKTTENLVEGLRLVAVEQASKAESYARPSRAGYFLKAISWKPMPLAAASLLLLLIAGAILATNRIRDLRSEVNQAKSDSAERESLLQEQRRNAERREQELAGQISQLEDKIQAGQKQPPDQPARPVDLAHPVMSLPVIYLKPVTRGEPAAGRVTLPRSPADLHFLLPLEGEVQHNDYHVTISDDRGGPVWKGRGFKPGDLRSLFIRVNSGLLRPGGYTFEVEGITSEGAYTPVGNYPVRAIKAR